MTSRLRTTASWGRLPGSAGTSPPSRDAPCSRRPGRWSTLTPNSDAELTTGQGANRAVRETICEMGKLDILTNNAGGYRLLTNHLTHAVAALYITEGK